MPGDRIASRSSPRRSAFGSAGCAALGTAGRLHPRLQEPLSSFPISRRPRSHGWRPPPGGRGEHTMCVREGERESGSRRSILDEPLCWAESYPVAWREPRVDLAELARLRWIKDLSRLEIAEKIGRTESAVQNYFHALRSRGLQGVGLTPAERKKIQKTIGPRQIRHQSRMRPIQKSRARNPPDAMK